jgi:hypothetical protein
MAMVQSSDIVASKVEYSARGHSLASNDRAHSLVMRHGDLTMQ